MTLHFFPLSPVASPDALPLSALRVRRPTVLHRGLLAVPVTIPAHSRSHGDAHHQQPPVAQRGLSTRRAMSPTRIDRVTVERAITSLPRNDRAVVETLHTVTKSGLTPSAPAPKAIVTVAWPWFARHPGDKERAVSSVSTTVSSDGLYRFITGGTAYRLTTAPQLSSLPGAVRVTRRAARTSTPIIPRLFAGRLMSPSGVEIDVAQTENRTYRIASRIQAARRNHLRFAARDGVIDPFEQAHADELMDIYEELEQKADDERAAIALIRTGRTKRTRGIVVDLFPSIGPEAA